MTTVYVTIDTEYCAGLVTGTGPQDREDCFARSIACLTPEGPAGVPHKLELLDRFGQKGVFFVDPMPALVWGVASIEDIVGPIVEAGHDVQLHLHTEWLKIAGAANPMNGKTGLFLHEFTFEEQCRLLEFARSTLIAAGAPAPIAFRAGNYGANDDTLRALAEVGIAYDTSHCPGIEGGNCRISLGPDDRQPLIHLPGPKGVTEVPIGSIAALGGGLRHAQVTALSAKEMLAAVRHARDTGEQCFTFVSHSFELINRRTLAVNRIVRRRFELLCAGLQKIRRVKTGTYADNPPVVIDHAGPIEPLPAEPLRSGMRVAEQIVSNTLYGAL